MSGVSMEPFVTLSSLNLALSAALDAFSAAFFAASGGCIATALFEHSLQQAATNCVGAATYCEVLKASSLVNKILQLLLVR